MKFILFLSILFVSICFIPGPAPSSIKWKLEIKNEYGNEKPIVLKKGRFTKITLILSPEDGKSYLDYSKDKSTFEIYLNDTNIKAIEDNFKVIPSQSLEYSTYIALYCQNNITNSNYTLQFKVKGKDKDSQKGQQSSKVNLNVLPVNVKIDNTRTKISLKPLKTSIPETSYSLFKLEEDLYNMNKIKIIAKNKDKSNNFVFTPIEIKEFTSKNGFKENNLLNDGILFEYPFGSPSTFKKLKNNTNFTFELELSDESDKKCFILDDNYKELTIKVVNKKPANLNNSTKEAIVYSIENNTPKKDKTNNIQIKMNIPQAPLILSCILQSNSVNKEKVEFKKYVIESGEQTFKFDDLRINVEYYMTCHFETTNFNKSLRNSFKISIGNKKGFDVVTQLVSSKDINRTPQCVKFNFGEDSNLTQLAQFESLALKYCYKIMNEEESILSRIMQSVICQSVQTKGQKQKQNNTNGKEKEQEPKNNIKKKYMICTGPSFNNYDRFFKKNSKKINFNQKFDKFCENLSNKTKIKKFLGLSGLNIKSIKRYYDNKAPDTSKITLTKVKSETKGKMVQKLKFNITSTNSQPIECYYNSNLNDEYNKRYISLGEQSIILNGKKDTKNFEVEIKGNKGKMMSLFMICYNLPGFKVRYESTGVFNAYTYYYSDSQEKEKEDDVPKMKKKTIDCNDKKNRRHPFCLKDRSKSIMNNMKTKMPDFIENMMDQSELFNQLSSSSQMKILQQTKEDLKEYKNKLNKTNSQNNRKELVEKSTELAEFLNKRDCSLYENKKDYKECRAKKKDILSDLISGIKQFFQCDKMVDIIKKGMTNDVEQNLKYILFLITEITNNADSLKKGESEVLYNLTLCLQENFEDYWKNVQSSLKEKSTLTSAVKAIKKDISFMLLKSLTNLINILHYDEIDGYVQNNNISKAGIMENSKGKKIQKGIFDFIKQFNDFGNGTYNISDKMNISVIVYEDDEKTKAQTRLLLEEPPKENEEENDEQIYNISDKGIYVILHPKKMMKRKKGHAMQFVVFDSPLIPIERNESNSTIRDFISITVFDKKGKEINITDLPKGERPVILYNKKHHKNLKHCFYYNETTEDLDTEGVESSDNFSHKGGKFFKCSSKHLTAFTAGDYTTSNSNSNSNSDSSTQDDTGSSNWWIILIIVLASIILIALVVFLIIHFRKDKVNSKTIESNFSGQEGIGV